MITLVALGAGLAVYLVLLSLIGYYCGEAPGALQPLMGQLRGEERTHQTPWWWAQDGQLSRRQRLLFTAAAAVVLALGGFLFFRSGWMAVLLACAAPLYPFTLERTLKRKRQELLGAQFGIALRAMAASLRAGASLRTAVERAVPDLERMLAGQPHKPIVAELEQVERDMSLGFSLEEALVRFRDRVNSEDVRDFVGAVLLCRVRGGNAALVMASIAEIIEDKIAVRHQITTLTAGKRMEGNMITFAPPVLIGVLTLTSPGYLAPLYERLAGQVMLLVGTACLVSAYVISRRLLEIDV
jgi:tight adherence protein B